MTDDHPVAGPGAAAHVQIALAEFAALRTEIERRAGIQWNVFALQVTSAGAVASVALSRSSSAALLLLVPLTSYMFGSRYVLHDHHIKIIHGYVRGALSPSLGGRLGWETWRDAAAGAASDRMFSATGWRWTHPTRLAFEGLGAMALVGACVAAAVQWSGTRPPAAEVVGSTLLFVLGVLVTARLHRTFVAAGTEPRVAPPPAVSRAGGSGRG